MFPEYQTSPFSGEDSVPLGKRLEWFTTHQVITLDFALPYCFGLQIPKGSPLPSLHFHTPSHKPLVFDLFIFKPERSPN